MSDRIIMYKSNYCPHSWSVERFLNQHEIEVEYVDIDGNPDARQKVMALNNGYASVPTLLFPDGTQLTEPSFRELRAKLDIEEDGGVIDRVRKLLNG